MNLLGQGYTIQIINQLVTEFQKITESKTNYEHISLSNHLLSSSQNLWDAAFPSSDWQGLPPFSFLGMLPVAFYIYYHHNKRLYGTKSLVGLAHVLPALSQLYCYGCCALELASAHVSFLLDFHSLCQKSRYSHIDYQDF